MGADLDPFAGDILNELQDAFLHMRRVFRLFDVLEQTRLQLPKRLAFRAVEQQAALLVVGDERVHIDAHKHTHLRHMLQQGRMANHPEDRR